MFILSATIWPEIGKVFLLHNTNCFTLLSQGSIIIPFPFHVLFFFTASIYKTYDTDFCMIVHPSLSLLNFLLSEFFLDSLFVVVLRWLIRYIYNITSCDSLNFFGLPFQGPVWQIRTSASLCFLDRGFELHRQTNGICKGEGVVKIRVLLRLLQKQINWSCG